MQLSPSWLGNCPVLEKEIIDGINKTHKIHIYTYVRPFLTCACFRTEKVGFESFSFK